DCREPDFFSIGCPSEAEGARVRRCQRLMLPTAIEQQDVSAIVGDDRMFENSKLRPVGRETNVREPACCPIDDLSERPFEPHVAASTAYDGQFVRLRVPVRPNDVSGDL